MYDLTSLIIAEKKFTMMTLQGSLAIDMTPIQARFHEWIHGTTNRESVVFHVYHLVPNAPTAFSWFRYIAENVLFYPEQGFIRVPGVSYWPLVKEHALSVTSVREPCFDLAFRYGNAKRVTFKDDKNNRFTVYFNQ